MLHWFCRFNIGFLDCENNRHEANNIHQYNNIHCKSMKGPRLYRLLARALANRFMHLFALELTQMSSHCLHPHMRHCVCKRSQGGLQCLQLPNERPTFVLYQRAIVKSLLDRSGRSMTIDKIRMTLCTWSLWAQNDLPQWLHRCIGSSGTSSHNDVPLVKPTAKAKAKSFRSKWI